MMTKQLLTDSDVGDLLKVTSVRVLRLAKLGKIPHVVLPTGEIRFIEDEVATWIREQRQPPKESE